MDSNESHIVLSRLRQCAPREPHKHLLIHAMSQAASPCQPKRTCSRDTGLPGHTARKGLSWKHAAYTQPSPTRQIFGVIALV